ncbi:colanic acid/amylovoran biosynthesis glycosyltransferase [Oceanihabitans sediminis]|uniref:Glycosyltransferase n=1 Tax=Oceanihabitans sediminis TaxID=1812012 RepID=A0A368P761_9FLAO|nr:glycosyltransferase family 4 protein [Oceanihabitans sediminis]RBP26594.1 colanic acid/amylovoran biosynthesis glycosyltransferase [Oceanihabitans sediminis]RCU57111.1 glycosyltransferase [Oceanihabitans sediminis]
MKKKIIIKTNSFPNYSETFIVSNIVYAIRSGYDVNIFCNKFLGLENSSQINELEKYGVKEMVLLPLTQTKSRLSKLLQLSSFLLKPRNLYYVLKYRSKSLKGFLKCASILKQYESARYKQAFHLHFNNSLDDLKEITSIGFMDPRVVITFHGYDSFLENKEEFQKKYGVFYKKHVKAVTVNSNYLKKVVLNLGISEELIHVIPIGINYSFFHGTPKSIKVKKEVQLITVGRLVSLKGQLYGLQAVKLLKELNYKIHYTIVGDGKNRGLLENEVERLGIADCVAFTGRSTQLQVKEYMRESDIFLMTSTFDEHTKRREAFGLVSIEAQAMGLPVIGFDSGGFPDTIIDGKTGFVVEDRDVLAMTEKIIYLLENQQMYKSMSKAAIHHAATFDHEFTTQKYLDLYDLLH